MLHHCIYPTARTVLYPSSTVLCQKRFVPRSTAHAVHGKQSHYEVLGLTPAASHADIRQAFVRLSKEIHPDRNPNDPDNHIKFVRLNEAYTVLSKHHTRREYDVSLAYWIRMQSQAKSHTVGHTSAPGFGGPRPDDPTSDPQQHRFWDETIFEMRDRTKDANAFYPEDAYYGIRGIRRQSNGVIAALCGVIVLLGFGYSQHKASQYQKKVDHVNRQLLRESRERARRNGTARQIELFTAMHSAKENSASDDANVSGEG